MTSISATTDPRAIVRSALDTAGDVVAGIRPDQLDGPTPCEDFDVRGMARHLLGVARRVGAIGRGEDPFSVPDVVEVPDGALVSAWQDAAAQFDAAWADDSTLERIVALPWSTRPGGETLTTTYLGEVSVHTWDLAVATGQQPAWDDDVLAIALDGIKAVLPGEGRAEAFEAIRQQVPEEMRGFEDPFGPPVVVPGDAALIDQLVAFTGRTPV